ncbi:MAG: glutamine-hydrolyzing carbamoyl-phosphate synthase small subunit [Clostridia bacterium]|nr:glutamine-hydrolyzing carbamoyl-phosphate synthase small subunit [Clostridia bacterium]
MEKAYLILENGRIFEGERFGARSDAFGEIVFQTGMVGYLEELTDPCYAGQILVNTFPLQGNYGAIAGDVSGKMVLSAFVAHDVCEQPSNFRADGTLSDLLEKHGIPGIKGVDTREITLILRNEGTMKAMIASEIPSDMSAFSGFAKENPVQKTGAVKTETLAQGENAKYTAALVNFGARPSFIEALHEKGFSVISVPYDAKAEEILSLNQDAVILSDGPGDPMDNAHCIPEIRKLVGKTPIFAQGLGHLMLALSMGARTEKMLFGHRGANQPVRDRKTGRTYITKQNHGYTVVPASLPAGAVMRLENANDHTCEGIDYEGANAFSVQFRIDGLKGQIERDFFISHLIEIMGG